MPDPGTGPAVRVPAEAELIAAMEAWDRAMVANDSDAIGSFMTDDWTIVGPDGSVGDKDRFLELVRSGDLTHDVMETHDPDIRLFGDVAVVISKGVSGGAYRGQPFHLNERVSSVFVRRGARWSCVLTHLSQLADA
jgi:ketosteroid isomerase-like protein